MQSLESEARVREGNVGQSDMLHDIIALNMKMADTHILVNETTV